MMADQHAVPHKTANPLKFGDTSLDLLAKHFHSFAPQFSLPPISIPSQIASPADISSNGPRFAAESKKSSPSEQSTHSCNSDHESHTNSKQFSCHWAQCNE